MFYIFNKELPGNFVTTDEILNELVAIGSPNPAACLSTILEHRCSVCPLYETCLNRKCSWHLEDYEVVD